MGKDGTEPRLRIVKAEQGLHDPFVDSPVAQMRGQEGIDALFEQHSDCPTCGSSAGHSPKKSQNWFICEGSRAVGRVGAIVISGLLDIPEAANEDGPLS